MLKRRPVLPGMLAGLLVIAFTHAAVAQEDDSSWSREKHFMAGLVWHKVDNATLAASEFGAPGGLTMKTSKADIYGVGFTLDWNDNLGFSMNMIGGSMDINASGNYAAHPEWGSSYSSKGASVFLWDWLAEYNFMRTRFTPMAVGGLTLGSLSGKLAEGRSFSESHISVVAGLGARWDITDCLMLKGLYRAEFMPVAESGGSFVLHGPSVVLGYTFDFSEMTYASPY